MIAVSQSLNQSVYQPTLSLGLIRESTDKNWENKVYQALNVYAMLVLSHVGSTGLRSERMMELTT